MMKVVAFTMLAAAVLSGQGADVAPLVDAAARWNGKCGYWSPNEDESKVAPYELEDTLVSTNGTRLASPADWPMRRQEILDIFAKNIYGEEPPKPKTLKWDLLGERTTAGGYATRRVFRMRFTEDGTGPSIDWALWIPRTAGEKKVPVILFLNYRGIHELVSDDDLPICRGWTRNRPRFHVENHRSTAKARGLLQDQNGDTVFPLQTILARGYAVMSASYTDVSPDPDPFGADGVDQYPFATTNGVFALWGPRDESRTDNITSLGAWAWALSRGLDLAEKQPEIDIRRSVVTGCSRLGKAAFIAAARDARFAVCVPNQCGGGGVCLGKRDFGENVSTENAMFTHWYCKAYRRYAANPAELMDFDMHLLLAAIAPRKVLVEGFGPNNWMDTKGEYLSAAAASSAWDFLGVPGLPKTGFPDYYDRSAIGPYLGYVRRTEGHGISGCDWNWTLDFADAAWENPYPNQRRIISNRWYEHVAVQQAKVRAARGKTVDLVLVGDSLTWNWECTGRGCGAFAELTNRYSVVNIGVPADNIQEIEWRCRNGQLDGYRARYAMVLAGTNNIWKEPADLVAERHAKLLKIIAEKQPEAKIIVMAPFPQGNEADYDRRPHCAALKKLLKAAADRQGLLWMDFDARLMGPDGSIPAAMMPDGLHIGPDGYRFWLEELTKTVLPAGVAEVRTSDYPTISAAVAACASQGGGRVVVPKGVYELNGPIHLKSNVELHLEEGAKLVFTDDYRAYLPAVRTNWEGIDAMGYSPLVYACGCTNVAVTGKGVFAPRVEGWVPWRNPKGMGPARTTQREWGETAAPLAERDLTKFEDAGFRPHLLQFLDCKSVRLDGFAVRGSPFWTIHLCRTEDVLVRNLDVSAWSESGIAMNNTDGIDIEMSRNVTVEGCTFRQNDDAIVIKAGRDREGRERGRPCEDILIRNCTVNAGHTLLGIGSELSAGVRNVRMENCRVDCEVWRLLYIKTNPRRGGFVENITMDGVTARKVTQDVIAVSSRVYYGMPGQEVAGPNPQLTRIEGVTMRNVHCDWALRAVTLLCDPDYPARNFRLENVVVDEVFENFVRVENVDGIKLDVTANKVHPDAHW